MAFTRFYIHDFEFRKSINTTEFEAWITINNRLLTPTANLIKLFRDENDTETRYIAQKFGVFLRFEDSRGRIKIVNNSYYSDNNVHRIEGALSSVIDRLTKDMDYLQRKSKLPPIYGGVRIHQHPPSIATGRLPVGGWEVKATAADTPPLLPREPGEILPSDPRVPNIAAPTTTHVAAPPPVPPLGLPPPISCEPSVAAPSLSAPQGTAGLIAIIYKPTPEILSNLFLNNIQYSLAPEFLFTQMFQQITPTP
jgi:hypothetical protein